MPLTLEMSSEHFDSFITFLISSLYSKQKDMSRVIEDGIAGRGGPSLRGDHRGGLPERGRGRGVGRGGGLNSGILTILFQNCICL